MILHYELADGRTYTINNVKSAEMFPEETSNNFERLKQMTPDDFAKFFFDRGISIDKDKKPIDTTLEFIEWLYEDNL